MLNAYQIPLLAVSFLLISSFSLQFPIVADAIDAATFAAEAQLTALRFPDFGEFCDCKVKIMKVFI